MRTLSLVLALGLSLCGNPQPFDPQIEVALDEPFLVRVGQSAEIAGADLRIRFDRVGEDSRCPSDVVCVWGGNARVQLTVEADGEVEALELNSGMDPRSTVLKGFRLSLEAVEPEARTTITIDPAEYLVSLRVTREP
jgi:hypothetical protein